MCAERATAEQAIGRIKKNLGRDRAWSQTKLGELIEAGLLKISDGTYSLNHSHQIFYDSNSSSIRHQKYLKSQLDLSKRALQRSYGKNARFYSHTFTISPEDFSFYANYLRETMASFTARSDETLGSEVVQLNMQLLRPEGFSF